MRLLVWLMLVLTCLGGCTSTRTVMPLREGTVDSVGLTKVLKRGDWVKVRTIDGTLYKGEVAALGHDSISLDLKPKYRSDEILVLAHEDIAGIEKVSVSFFKSLGLLAGTAGVVCFFAMLAFISQFEGME